MEKAKVLDVFFTSVFSGQFDLRLPTTKNPTALRLEGKSGAQKVYWGKVQVREFKQNEHMQVHGPDGIHPFVPRELANVSVISL